MLRSFMCRYFRDEQNVQLSQNKQVTVLALKEIIATIYKIIPTHLGTAFDLERMKRDLNNMLRRGLKRNDADVFDIFDWLMFLIFAFTRLLESILFNPEFVISNFRAVSSARLLCPILFVMHGMRFFQCCEVRRQVLPCLFWCGIILNDSVDHQCKIIRVFIN